MTQLSFPTFLHCIYRTLLYTVVRPNMSTGAVTALAVSAPTLTNLGQRLLVNK